MLEIIPNVWYKITATFVAVILLLLISAIGFAVYYPLHPGDKSITELTILPGEGVHDIAGHLKIYGLIRSEYLFNIYTRLSGKETHLKAGRYQLSPSMSIPGILRVLSMGLAISDDVVVVIPEGSNIWEIDSRLFSAGLLEYAGDFVRQEYMSEGYLFPDTYRFSLKLKAQPGRLNVPTIAKAMKDNFELKTRHPSGETIIIASILEKEAKTPEDMALVAGIIKNRNDRRIKLEIDAAVAYGECMKKITARKFNPLCDVTQVNLIDGIATDGPYNMYMRLGLPPGPISNPGLKAIIAAQNPTPSDYFFYLSTRDGSQIIYSKTADEHAANRRKYLGL